MEHSDLLAEIELIRRALALKHRIGALYSYHDAYYLTPPQIDISDPFGSARRISRKDLSEIVAAAELEEAHATRPGPDRETSRKKQWKSQTMRLPLNQIVVRMILRRDSACIPQRGRLNARFALSQRHKVVCRELMS